MLKVNNQHNLVEGTLELKWLMMPEVKLPDHINKFIDGKLYFECSYDKHFSSLS